MLSFNVLDDKDWLLTHKKQTLKIHYWNDLPGRAVCGIAAVFDKNRDDNF